MVEDTMADERPDTTRTLTVPNVITTARIVGTGGLAWLAGEGHETAFVWLLAALIATDWIDGKIAVLFHQRTTLGARLDSVADALLYATLVLCAWWLRPQFIRDEFWLLAVTGMSYGLTLLIAFVRFGRFPAYHTRVAKTCWFLMAAGAIALFAGGPTWIARIALVVVIIGNLEETAISLVLRETATNVPSIVHAVRRRRTS
jgi:CDP-diacylglycerol--glycerol-3-phosphate 3-phosphatidyltransferase